MNVLGAVVTLIAGFVAAGVMILVFRPFKIGDAVNLGGDVYIMDALGFFICKAHLPDGPTAYLPNSKIWGATIIMIGQDGATG